MQHKFVLIAQLLCASCSLNAQQTDSARQLALEWTDRLTAIEKLVSDHVPQAAAEIKQVKIHLVDSGDISRVYASQIGGIHTIDISLGFIVMVHQIVVAVQSLPSSQAIGYTKDYVNELIRRSRAGNQVQESAINDPWTWAGWSNEEKDCFERDAGKNQEIGTLETATVAFVVCHELGHLVLGHLRVPPKTPEESQAREAAADRFASDAVSASNVTPLVGVYAMLFYAALDASEIGSQKARSHPMSISRIDAIVDATLASLSKITLDVTSGITKDQVRSQIQGMSAVLKKDIAAGRFSFESSDPWSRGGTLGSAASRFQNDDSVSDSISVDGIPEVEWHTKVDNPTVRYAVHYKNEGTKRIECAIQIAVGAVPRAKSATPHWEEVSKNTHHFILNPGQATVIQGTLWWMANSTLMPQIEIPDPSIEEGKQYYRCRLQ